MRLISNVIDGEAVESLSGECFDTVDPWTRQPWAEVALSGPDDVGRAVAAARSAFDTGPWPRMTSVERGTILHRLADLVDEHRDELALADTTDMGKPISQGRATDVPHAANTLRFFADHARLASGATLPVDGGHHCYTSFPPAGVVAAISPWNFPLMLATWKLAPALAWGNTVVLKPAEGAPASASMLGRLALEAGLPAGVLNVVHGFGPDSAGEALTSDPRVDRITFTGESATGRAIARAAAANLTPVSFELGGKGASLVFDDADLDGAVTWSARSTFSNAGQVCLACARIYVHRDRYETFVERLCAQAASLVVGDPKDAGTQVGPLASGEHHDKVRSFLDGVDADGGVIRCGGPGAGWTVRPTVVTDVKAGARIWREEIFGPVAVVAPFDSEPEAIAAANDTPYGLTAAVFTENLSRAHRVAAALRAGTVWANCFFVRDLRAPFGGAGDSGIGREGGDYSREFFTEPKAVVMAIAPVGG